MTDDSEAPERVVERFIAAMNAWEKQAWQESRAARGSADPSSCWPVITEAMEAVFAAYCTARERPQGRRASFQRPPEYDPGQERVSGVEVDGPRAFVLTERRAVLGGGTRRYVLHRCAQRWRIDSVSRLVEGAWQRAIL